MLKIKLKTKSQISKDCKKQSKLSAIKHLKQENVKNMHSLPFLLIKTQQSQLLVASGQHIFGQYDLLSDEGTYKQ